MEHNLKTEPKGLIQNLANGLRSLVFRQESIGRYRITTDQVLLLILFYGLTIFCGSYYLSSPNPQISLYGISNIATQAFAILLAVFVVSKVTKRQETILPLWIVLLSTWPWFYLAWLLIGNDANFSLWQFYEDDAPLYILYNIWFVAVLVNSTASLVGYSLQNMLKSLGAYVLIIGVPLHFSYLGQFWHMSYKEREELVAYQNINEEETYYKQFELMDEFKGTTLPERPGVSDIYFVGFGSYAMQDVFMKEVRYAKRLFDKRFDTQGRSAALINNIKTIDEFPLATASNLSGVITHVGELINPDEDILFLYLTSHGSEQHELAVDLVPLNLNLVNPVFLKQSLDEAQIKYRVILVSACYSGGFVEPLKDENTLIMTAADVDRKSFGCSHESDFTYFGKAVFEEQLSHNRDFIDAFNQAIESIHGREKVEQLEPSRPQIFVGDGIRDKLEMVANELEKYYTENTAL